MRTSSPPPATRAISRTDAFTGSGAARAALLAARARAATGSGTAAAIDRQLELWRRYLGPDSGSGPAGRRATMARALHANAWWYSRWRSPPQQVLLRDPDGVILTYRVRQGFAVNPVAPGRLAAVYPTTPSPPWPTGGPAMSRPPTSPAGNAADRVGLVGAQHRSQ